MGGVERMIGVKVLVEKGMLEEEVELVEVWVDLGGDEELVVEVTGVGVEEVRLVVGKFRERFREYWEKGYMDL